MWIASFLPYRDLTPICTSIVDIISQLEDMPLMLMLFLYCPGVYGVGNADDGSSRPRCSVFDGVNNTSFLPWFIAFSAWVG